jgi:hypothetical protein
MPRVILCMCVTLLASSSLSGTFFCVTTHTLSAPRTASDVRATDFTALNAYSTCGTSSAAREARRGWRCCGSCLEQSPFGREDGDVPGRGEAGVSRWPRAAAGEARRS